MNDPLIRLLFLAHLGSTLFMLGVIWIIQIVHYPLFANVGKLDFSAYEQRHTKIITWVVAPAMFVEGTTAAILFFFPPTEVSTGELWVGVVLLIVIWLSTALLQVPCHAALARSYSPRIHRRLVWTNWLRTIAWSLRGLLVLWMAWSSLA